MFICEYCSKEWDNIRSKAQHQIRCKENPNKIEATNQYKKAKELGLPPPEMSIETRKKISEATRKQNETMWTTEFRKKHSESMKKAVLENPDSYTKNNVCGRVKNIEYNGHILKGSWELIVAKWLDRQNITWESEVNPQTYIFKDKDHLYFPDFYLIDYNIYIEVKGYKRERDEAKWSQFNNTLLIVDSTIINKLDDYNINHLIKERTYAPIA